MPLRGAARGMAWMRASGLPFIALTTVTRFPAQELPPWRTQCLRFAAGLLVMMPWILRRGVISFRLAHRWACLPRRDAFLGAAALMLRPPLQADRRDRRDRRLRAAVRADRCRAVPEGAGGRGALPG
jgi:hypothetical protein